MFILLLSTMPNAVLDARAKANAIHTHTHRRRIRVRLRRIVIALLAHVFHAVGLDR